VNQVRPAAKRTATESSTMGGTLKVPLGTLKKTGDSP
jgi:hypothetical protein